MNTIPRKQHGFTIVELLIVIVVIGILAAITIVAYNGIQDRAQRSVVSSATASLTQKLQSEHVIHEAYPGAITDCPTPGAGNLCLSLSDGTETSYAQYPAGTGSGYRSYKENSYDLGVMNERAFLYTGVGERMSTNEFMQYTDLAPYINKYGVNRKYKLSFDVRSTTSATGDVMAYFQNGSSTRHSITGIWVPVTTSYTHHTITFTPQLASSSDPMSLLAFYGKYGTNVIPAVKNVSFRLAP